MCHVTCSNFNAMIYYLKYPYKLELSLYTRIIPIGKLEIPLKCIYCIVFWPNYPHNAYIIPQKIYQHCLRREISHNCIILDLELKYPLIAYIILELKFKYPLIAYIILGLKKIQNIFKPDNRLGGSTNMIHFVLRSFVDMANNYDRADLRKLQKKY